MKHKRKQKLYCYVDETGQDTAGKLYIVSVVIAQKDRDEIEKILEKIEKETGKGKTKWTRSKKEFKVAYLERVLTNKAFRRKIFHSFSKDTRAYRELTLITIASAITNVKEKDDYKASIFIDGLQRTQIFRVGSGLRKIGVQTQKVRGIRDESSAIIRLADTVAGLVREQAEGIGYAKKLYKIGTDNKCLTKV